MARNSFVPPNLPPLLTFATQEQNVVTNIYLLYRFTDNLLVLLLCDFLPLVKRFDGCLHFIYSFLLDLLLLKQKEDVGLLV